MALNGYVHGRKHEATPGMCAYCCVMQLLAAERTLINMGVFCRWAVEHNLSIAHISRAPKSRAVIGALKDGLHGGLLDIRSVRQLSVYLWLC
jgi:hypothetical protein